MSASGYEKERLDKLKKMKGIHVDGSNNNNNNNKDGTQDATLKKKRKTKGVNPLAAKKKKSKNNGAFGKQTDPTKVCFRSLLFWVLVQKSVFIVCLNEANTL